MSNTIVLTPYCFHKFNQYGKIEKQTYKNNNYNYSIRTC